MSGVTARPQAALNEFNRRRNVATIQKATKATPQFCTYEKQNTENKWSVPWCNALSFERTTHKIYQCSPCAERRKSTVLFYCIFKCYSQISIKFGTLR